uniref:KIB1-4 beta-propeller domain-containing protein n=1 Tax=Davidia involucrata TaxID=16924 RepID=A0A5B6YLY7_DAVIN
MGFADVMQSGRRCMRKVWGIYSNTARFRNSIGGRRVDGGGLPSSFVESSESVLQEIEPPPLVFGSRGFEKASPSFSLMMMRRGFSSLQGASSAPTTTTTTRLSSPWLTLPAGFAAGGGDTLIKEAAAEPKAEDKDYYNYNHFFSLAEKKVLRIRKNLRMPWQGEILSPDDSKCVGSSHGWLAFISRQNCKLYLYNPLIDPHSSLLPFIPLPPIETLPSILSKVCRKEKVTDSDSDSFSMVTEFVSRNQMSAVSSVEICKTFIRRVVLSSAPSPMPSKTKKNNETGCTVMVIHGHTEFKLAFCRPGDTSWTALDGPQESYQALLYFNKHQLFYALSFSGSLEAWDLRNPYSPERTLVKSKVPQVLPPTPMDEHQRFLRINCLSKKYIVESSSGDLLMVHRYYCFGIDDNGEIVTYDRLKDDGNDFSTYPSKRTTLAFDVYKLDFDKKKWEYVPSLGDEALFLGLNHSVSLSVRDLPELSGNSIYFTCIDAELCLNMSDGSHDMGVFNLEDNSITPLYQCTSISKRIQPPPIWIVPPP